MIVFKAREQKRACGLKDVMKFINYLYNFWMHNTLIRIPTVLQYFCLKKRRGETLLWEKL